MAGKLSIPWTSFQPESTEGWLLRLSRAVRSRVPIIASLQLFRWPPQPVRACRDRRYSSRCRRQKQLPRGNLDASRRDTEPQPDLQAEAGRQQLFRGGKWIRDGSQFMGSDRRRIVARLSQVLLTLAGADHNRFEAHHDRCNRERFLHDFDQSFRSTEQRLPEGGGSLTHYRYS